MSRMFRRGTTVFSVLAMVLAMVPAALAIPAPPDVEATGETSAAGPGVVVNETGEPGNAVYMVLHEAPSLAQYRGGIAGLAATSPEATGASRLDVDSAASRAYLAHLTSQQDSLISAIDAEIGRSVDVKFRYDATLNGFAVVMNPDEAAAVASLPSVRRVERDSTRELLTDNGPRWIGADAIWGEDPPAGSAACVGTCGEGVVAGIIDTGVNFDHPSFADIGGDDYDHSNPKGTFFGACDPVTGLPFCNDKLIGFYDFTGTGPEDDNGHGSHTASTTAGNVLTAVLEAPTITLTRDISGVAPHANIISYKGCSGTPIGCQLSALLASINQATIDEVDVINYSIGGSSANPWADLDAQAFFDATTAGIFVATSAGNSGPGFGTMGSPADAPWVTAVGASTHDRKLANGLINMTNADSSAGPADIFGASLTAPLAPARVVYAGDYGSAECGEGAADPATGDSAINPFPPGTFSGEIVVCDRGTYGRVAKARNVQEGGAGGYVLANDAANGDSLVADAYPIPGVHISYDDGIIVKDWIEAGGGASHQGTAEIRGSNPSEDPASADIMASFSSRGANLAAPSVIKPDVTAPGVDILAAWMSPVGSVGGDPEFNIISGTSMSSPHTAGSGALVLADNPGWSPEAVKSALMTTAFTTLPGTDGEVHGVLKEDGVTPADPFDMGAGRVDLRLAADAGVVFEESAADYQAASPALGGDPSTLNLPSLGDDFCPSSCTWTRSMTSTASTSVTWTPSATTPAGMSITFDQASYTIAAGGTVDITITADVAGVSPKGDWTFAEVQLTPNTSTYPAAHLPVAVIPGAGPSPVVLHMHGNIHDGCVGNGPTDIATTPDCSPFLDADPVLDSAPAAEWGPINPALDGTNPVNVFDPNWEWTLTEPTTLEGPMTVEWWYGGPTVNTVFFDDFDIKLFADDNLVLEERVRHNVTAPNVPELLRSTVTVPKSTAGTSFVLQIDPVFANQSESFIYYDSTQSCPGVTAAVPCDSRVSMPVVDSAQDSPPIANDDEAFVINGGTVIIDVLANDSDAEGPLALEIESGPSNGTAEVTTDNKVRYTHDGSPTTSDSFVYKVTDTAGQTDTATVNITISDECLVAGEGYSDDFESGAPGWTVDTAVLNDPTSQTWQLFSPDPLATSPTTVWFTDALASDAVGGGTVKDVRLVSPELLISNVSHLTFWHRFDTEPAFDGGVLEVSLDNGATWQDILAAGGVFVTGAYNSIIDPSNSDNALQGRAAWSGPSTPPVGATEMSQVDVDVTALAGSTVNFRFRLAQDELFGQPGGGWWIDDVTVTSLFEPCGSAPVANDDTDSVDRGGTVNTDVKANDTDADNDNSELTVTIESAPSHGTAVVEADGTVTYTHNGNTATSDSYQYRITDPDGAFDTATVTITINQDGNAPPNAVDDTGSVDAGGSTTIDVKANDSDPDHDNSELTVTIETQPSSGIAGVTADGQVTYTHNGDSATSDSFQYRLTDPDGAFDIATVTITINQDGGGEPGDTGDKVTGGGYLLATDGEKINFGFNAKAKTDESLQGHLSLNDKSDGVKIKIDTITSLAEVGEGCGTVGPGTSSAEFTGTGTYNGDPAEFRVCVADLGEPGTSGDLFYLECLTGCVYNTGNRTDDDEIDGGNIQVHKAAGTEDTGAGSEGAAPENGTAPDQATVLILDPLLLTEAAVGDSLELTVVAFDANSEPLANAPVSLNIETTAGVVTFDGLSDAEGLVTFLVDIAAGETEYRAHSELVSSNTIDVTAILTAQ